MMLSLGRFASLFVLLAAAALEVAGDALVRKGLRGGGALLAIAGVALLGGYAVLVNLGALDFSSALGAYVGVFAVASVLAGRLFFGDRAPPSTWIGLAIILAGSLVIQFGRRPR